MIAVSITAPKTHQGSQSRAAIAIVLTKPRLPNGTIQLAARTALRDEERQNHDQQHRFVRNANGLPVNGKSLSSAQRLLAANASIVAPCSRL